MVLLTEYPWVLFVHRKRHSDVIQRAQRLKQDDSATDRGRRDAGTGSEEQDNSATTEEIRVRDTKSG